MLSFGSKYPTIFRIIGYILMQDKKDRGDLRKQIDWFLFQVFTGTNLEWFLKVCPVIMNTEVKYICVCVNIY